MGDVLAIAEQRDGRLRGVSREVVTAARTVADGLAGEVHALAIGAAGLSSAVSELGAFGADRILVAEDAGLDPYHADKHRDVIRDVAARGYEAIVFAATAQGKDLAPRVAAGLNVPLAADVTGVAIDDDGLKVTRPVYAGKAFSRLSFKATPAVFSIRPNVFPAVESAKAGATELIDASYGESSVRRVEYRAASAGALDVAEATIVVSGGRGMKDPDNWHLLEGLRDAIGDGAGLGASRAVVDAGWRPHGEQVGQTGKTVAPKLYFALGISGAIQHLAGMRTAGTIVAVNKDADAPIFQVADYGVVGDVFEVLPALTEGIRALKAGG